MQECTHACQLPSSRRQPESPHPNIHSQTLSPKPETLNLKPKAVILRACSPGWLSAVSLESRGGVRILEVYGSEGLEPKFRVQDFWCSGSSGFRGPLLEAVLLGLWVVSREWA